MTEKENLEKFLEPIFSRKPASVSALDVHNLTSYTDVIIIVTGNSARQIKTLGEHIIKTLKKQGVKALGVEGMQKGNWILMDYGWVIVHLFDIETNALYDLENLWSDALPIDISKYR